MKKLETVLCIYIAFVFIQSLFYKFTGSPETVYIFNTLANWSGLNWFGAYGGYMVGTVELIASIMLFTALRLYGALVAMMVMSGAIFFHLFTPLGILMPTFKNGQIVGNDGGLLFYMACGVWIAAAIVSVNQLIKCKKADKNLFANH